MSLTLCERPDLLDLADLIAAQELPAPRASPTTLTDQELSHRPAAGLGWGGEDDRRCGDFAVCDPSLQLRTRESDRIGLLKGAQSLRRWGHPGHLHYVDLSPCVVIRAWRTREHVSLTPPTSVAPC
jgi:hypothetical protein